MPTSQGAEPERRVDLFTFVKRLPCLEGRVDSSGVAPIVLVGLPWLDGLLAKQPQQA